jgi:small conductance mechanosensitive channel
VFSVQEILEYLQTQGPILATRFGVALLVGVGIYVAGRILSAALAKVVARGKAAKLVPTFTSILHVIITVTAVLTALEHVGVNVTTLIAGAGVVGIAVGFGSQALVRDIISGFFLLFDGALSPGDVAKVGDVQGTVESVGFRVTRIRALNGQLFYIPNGHITIVGNFSRDWSRAIVEVGVAYEQDVNRGLEVLRDVAKQWAEEHADIVLEPPEAQGVLGLNASDVGLRIIAKVKPGEHWAAEREIRARIKSAFDTHGVEIPFPRRVVYHRQEDSALSAAPRHETVPVDRVRTSP